MIKTDLSELIKEGKERSKGKRVDIAFLLVILLLGIIPAATDAPYVLHVLTLFLLYVALSLTWNLIMHSGLLSFGHAIFIGIGAYSSVFMINTMGLHPVTGMLLGCGLSFLLALIVGFISIRLGGIYFAIFTVVLFFLMRSISKHLDPIGIPPWENVLPSLFSPQFESTGYFLTAWIICVITSVILFSIYHRKTILTITAIREGELGIRTLGVATLRMKVMIFCLTAVCCSLIGSIYSHFNIFVSPETGFNMWFSIKPIVYAFFGGIYTFSGPIFGCILLLLDMLVFTPLLPAMGPIIYGVFIVLIVLFLPGGVMPAIIKRFSSKTEL